jgi:hypothetical protein
VATFGPGTMPWMIIAPIISAMTGLDRIPSVSSGMNEVCAPALFADSGPATPSIAPLPNSSGVFRDAFFHRVGGEGGENGAAAGQNAERSSPSAVPRRIGAAMRRKSSRVGIQVGDLLDIRTVAVISRFRDFAGFRRRRRRRRNGHEIQSIGIFADAEREARACLNRCRCRRGRAAGRAPASPAP